MDKKESEYGTNIMYNVCKQKNEKCWNCSRNGGDIKENDGGGEFNCDIL
jgi:hypothetical protein